MARARERTFPMRLLVLLHRSWRTVVGRVLKLLVVLAVAFIIFEGFSDGRNGILGRANSIILIAVLCVSVAYLIFVSSQVRLIVPGINGNALNSEPDPSVHRGEKDDEKDVVTLEVRRRSSDYERITIANDSPLPVLRAEVVLRVVSESTDGGQVLPMAFSIPAHGTRPTSTHEVFEHVGIFGMHSAGVRIFDLLGLFSRMVVMPGKWRFRVVPNVYRLTYGIPKERWVNQETLGIPDTPADALDYNRVRDYQIGDPLKTIHWKLVAHGNGELYTKIFETPTDTGATLVIDPFGPDATGDLADGAYHLHDTMLEGGFSLLEHARQCEIACELRYVNQSGRFVTASWPGASLLGLFVETAMRPSSTGEARERSVTSILSLGLGCGYVIFATSALSEDSVGALIASHLAGMPLVVVHALPPSSHIDGNRQRRFDARLRRAGVGVIALLDGPQIVKEVGTS